MKLVRMPLFDRALQILLHAKSPYLSNSKCLCDCQLSLQSGFSLQFPRQVISELLQGLLCPLLCTPSCFFQGFGFFLLISFMCQTSSLLFSYFTAISYFSHLFLSTLSLVEKENQVNTLYGARHPNTTVTIITLSLLSSKSAFSQTFEQ